MAVKMVCVWGCVCVCVFVCLCVCVWLSVRNLQDCISEADVRESWRRRLVADKSRSTWHWCIGCRSTVCWPAQEVLLLVVITLTSRALLMAFSPCCWSDDLIVVKSSHASRNRNCNCDCIMRILVHLLHSEWRCITLSIQYLSQSWHFSISLLLGRVFRADGPDNTECRVVKLVWKCGVVWSLVLVEWR